MKKLKKIKILFLLSLLFSINSNHIFAYPHESPSEEEAQISEELASDSEGETFQQMFGSPGRSAFTRTPGRTPGKRTREEAPTPDQPPRKMARTEMPTGLTPQMKHLWRTAPKIEDGLQPPACVRRLYFGEDTQQNRDDDIQRHLDEFLDGPPLQETPSSLFVPSETPTDTPRPMPTHLAIGSPKTPQTPVNPSPKPIGKKAKAVSILQILQREVGTDHSKLLTHFKIYKGQLCSKDPAKSPLKMCSDDFEQKIFPIVNTPHIGTPRDLTPAIPTQSPHAITHQGGFHHTPQPERTPTLRPTSRNHKTGVFGAEILTRSPGTNFPTRPMPTKYSTFFPSKWSRSELIENIQRISSEEFRIAINNGVILGRHIEEDGTEILIEAVMNSRGHIVKTAYPIFRHVDFTIKPIVMNEETLRIHQCAQRAKEKNRIKYRFIDPTTKREKIIVDIADQLDDLQIPTGFYVTLYANSPCPSPPIPPYSPKP